MKTTTKIMGVVLAVFVALAVFAGAGAAANPHLTIIFPYTDVTEYTDLTGNETLALWADNGITKINFVPDGEAYYFTAPFTEGRYTASLAGVQTGVYTVSLPDAFLKLSVYDIKDSDIAGKTISKKSGMNITVVDPYIFDIDYLLFTTPAGGKSMILGNSLLGDSAGSKNNWFNATGDSDKKYTKYNATFSTNGSALSKWEVVSGQWYVQAHIRGVATEDYKAADIPAQYLAGSTLYPFYVKGTENSITADKDTVIRGNSFIVTIAGAATTDTDFANKQYLNVTVSDGNKGLNLLPGQQYVKSNDGFADVTKFDIERIPATGEVKVQFNTDINTEAKNYKITAQFEKGQSPKSVTVKVVKGGVTIDSDLEDGQTYIGNEVHFFGTNTETDQVLLMIKGVNKPTQEIKVQNNQGDDTALGLIEVLDDHTWDKKFTIANRFDAGTYTIYAVATTDGDYAKSKSTPSEYDYKAKIDADKVTYATYQLTLLKPFLTAVPDQTSIAEGDKVRISGQVEGEPEFLYYYVLGTNFFNYDTIEVEDDGTYSKKISIIDANGVKGQAGEYFILVQHPMYDKLFNVVPADKVFTYGNDGKATDIVNVNYFGKNNDHEKYILLNKSQGKKEDMFNILSFATLENDYQLVWRDELSNMNTRQKANAAVALTDLINEEYVDDLYVAVDIVVGNPWLLVNSIADVTEGSEFTVDGTTNLKSGTQVTVEIMSSKFAAVSKIDVSDSAYLIGTCKVVKGDANGNTWSVTFNNNHLNVDAYTVTAKTTGDVAASDTTTMNIVAAGPEPQPTTEPTAEPTTAPTTAPTAVPTATATPASPGFGALIALAGLGAAAVLLLRRE